MRNKSKEKFINWNKVSLSEVYVINMINLIILSSLDIEKDLDRW